MTANRVGQGVAPLFAYGGTQRARERGGVQVGDRVADPVDECAGVGFGGVLLRAVRADEVRGGRTEQLASPHPADHRDRGLGAVRPPDRGEHLLLQMGAAARLQPLRVAEDRHRLGGPQQQVGGEPAGRQDAGEILRGRALVAQQPQVPGGLAERVGHLAEAEQPGVRVGGVREPAEQHRQQGALDGGLAGNPGGQRLQVPERGGRIGVPEGFEPVPGGLRAEPGLAGRELGDGVEQRPVEQLLVQPPHHGRVPLPLLVELGDRVRTHPEGAAEPAQIRLVLGDEVGAAQPVQLDAVLHGAQEAVRVVELRGVHPPDVAARGERPQGVQGRAAVQGGVAAAVHELEQLYGELDVPQSAGSELELPVDRSAGMLSTTRRRIFCTSATKFSRSAACHTSGETASTYSAPSSGSPATGRALSSAWNSHVLAQRW